MNNFKDFFIEFQENELKNKEESKYGPTELIFERYFDLLCSVQSNYDFYEFIDDFYIYAKGKALNCVDIGIDTASIDDRKIDDWIANVTKCMYALLGKYLLRIGIEVEPDQQNGERKINKEIGKLGGGWEKIKNKLWILHQETRNPAAHIPLGLMMNKSTQISKEELNNKYKNLFIIVHKDSLKNIRKDYPNYDK
jgi:hypothetical protein